MRVWSLRTCLTVALIGLSAAAPSAAQTPPAQPVAALPGYALSATRVEQVTSSVNGHRYTMMIGMPLLPPPADGYGVIYVLDGDFYFASVLEAVRATSPTTMVIGIGYPLVDESWVKAAIDRHGPLPPLPPAFPKSLIAAALERSYDLTLPASDQALAAQQLPGGPPQRASDVGGADDLLRAIERDIKPRVAAIAKVDDRQQALFGYSLGGLVVVRALFTEPSAFRTFIAGSPSIWWNDRAVLGGEAAFAAAVTNGKAAPRVLITVGSDEDIPPPLPPGTKGADIFTRVHMVQNAQGLADRLKMLPGQPPYRVEFAEFAAQAHGISFWPALGRAIPFVTAK